jgi:aconitate hydratase
VLSGNRNFEARVHQSIKANFLMSPPLVVAFAIAGRVDIDLTTEPLGTGLAMALLFTSRNLAHQSGNRATPCSASSLRDVFQKLYTGLRRSESEVE